MPRFASTFAASPKPEKASAPRRSSWRSTFDPRALRDAVLLEPCQHALPAVVGRFLAIARAVVGVEGVRHAFVDVDLRLLVVAECLQAGAQHLDALERDALVRAAVE